MCSRCSTSRLDFLTCSMALLLMCSLNLSLRLRLSILLWPVATAGYNIESTMAEQERVFTSQEDPEWVDKTRTLVVSSRGMTAAQRLLMLSVFALLPHSKKEYTLEKHGVREQIDELCLTHKTRYFVYFEVKKKVNFSIWVGRYPEGPSMKFKIDGIVHTRDIKFQGNSVKGARQVLSFDAAMDADPRMRVAKQLFIGAFNVPKYHPKSTAVIDHTLSFVVDEDNINFKNYQIFREAVSKDQNKIDLYQIGPRFILTPQCILDGVMGGEVLYRAPVYKKLLKKPQDDKRKYREQEEPGVFNLFGEEGDN